MTTAKHNMDCYFEILKHVKLKCIFPYMILFRNIRNRRNVRRIVGMQAALRENKSSRFTTLFATNRAVELNEPRCEKIVVCICVNKDAAPLFSLHR